MTKDEAINWIINISADIGKAEHSDLWHYEQALSEIRDMLESAQPEPQWIPVKERLPEKYKDVLTTYTIQPWRSKKPKRFVHIAEWMGDGWESPIDEYLVRDEVAKIRYLAWAEIPEPWRGEEHETD